jgi:hypothetical protein
MLQNKLPYEEINCTGLRRPSVSIPWLNVYEMDRQLSVPRPYSALKIQLRVDNHDTSTLVILLRFGKLPTVKDCDMVKVVRNIRALESKIFSLFIIDNWITAILTF